MHRGNFHHPASKCFVVLPYLYPIIFLLQERTSMPCVIPLPTSSSVWCSLCICMAGQTMGSLVIVVSDRTLDRMEQLFAVFMASSYQISTLHIEYGLKIWWLIIGLIVIPISGENQVLSDIISECYPFQSGNILVTMHTVWQPQFSTVKLTLRNEWTMIKTSIKISCSQVFNILLEIILILNVI